MVQRREDEEQRCILGVLDGMVGQLEAEELVRLDREDRFKQHSALSQGVIDLKALETSAEDAQKVAQAALEAKLEANRGTKADLIRDVSGPEQEEALHSEVGEGDDRHPGREDHLQQTS